MDNINDFESSSIHGMEIALDDRSRMPKFAGSAIKARRCIKCNKIVFANSDANDYECMRCRPLLQVIETK